MTRVAESVLGAQAPPARTLDDVYAAVAQLRGEVAALREMLAPITLYAPEPSAAPQSQEREQRQTPGANQSRPGPEASPRQWFDYLAALARDYRIAVPPTPGPGVDNDEIVAQNSRLKAAIQAAQQARQGGE